MNGKAEPFRPARARPALLAALGLALLLFAGGSAAVAADPPAAAWSPLPLWGGDVRSLAIDPEDPDRIFAGTSSGQLYVSRNGGASWAPAGSPLPFPGWVVGTLRWDPNRPGRLWAGLWGVWGGGHVASSDDGGKTWASRAAGLPEEPVYSVALVPGLPGRLYAGTLSGVWRSDDGGEGWRRLTGALPEIQKVTSLYVDPERPEMVIAGTWRRAYRSEDGGRSWAGVFEGMVLDSEVFSMTPVPGRPGEIWATTCGWVYRTADRGDRWERFKEGFQERRTVSFAVLSDGRLLAGTVAGLHLSADGGRSWGPVADPGLSVLAIAHHPRRPERVILGTEGSGVWVSNNGAKSFFPSSRGMANLRVSALAKVGGELFVAVAHAGPLSGVHVSRDGGNSFDGGSFSPLPSVLDFAWHAGRLYAATERGLYERRGESWHRLPELGEARVEQLVRDGFRLLARTREGFWEVQGPRLARRDWRHGAPRSAALFGGALWASDADGVYRLTEATNDTVPAPTRGGRLHRLDDRLLLVGEGGVWTWDGGAEGSWTRLMEGPARLVPTEDGRFPALLASGDTLRLYHRESRSFRKLEAPVPARDVSSAVLAGGRLLLGTAGYGVLEVPLP